MTAAPTFAEASDSYSKSSGWDRCPDAPPLPPSVVVAAPAACPSVGWFWSCTCLHAYQVLVVVLDVSSEPQTLSFSVVTTTLGRPSAPSMLHGLVADEPQERAPGGIPSAPSMLYGLAADEPQERALVQGRGGIPSAPSMLYGLAADEPQERALVQGGSRRRRPCSTASPRMNRRSEPPLSAACI